MDNLLLAEIRYREHDERIARINREAWKKQHLWPSARPGRLRIAVAKRLRLGDMARSHDPGTTGGFVTERSVTVLENMSGIVGLAAHEERLAHAKNDARVVEAAATREGARAPSHRQGWRRIIANALLAIATRLAPTVRTHSTDTSI
jgi:hypothetical protein